MKRIHGNTPIVRFQAIVRALVTGKYPNANTMSRELEVSPKSIYRDIDYMRDQLQLPIEYDRSHYGYRLTEPVHVCPVCAGKT